MKCNGGSASPGDVVSAMFEGQLVVGELLICVGITFTNQKPILVAIIAKWDPQVGPPLASSDKVDDYYVEYLVPLDADRIKVDVNSALDTVFTHRKADDGRSCMVCLPHECRLNRS